MARAIDADIVNPRFDAEGVKQSVVVVRKSVAFVDRDVYFICALDEIEAVYRERGFGVAAAGSQSGAVDVPLPNSMSEVKPGRRVRRTSALVAPSAAAAARCRS